jgi:hypothetical protein
MTDYRPVLPVGTTYYLPEVVTHLPAACHPDCASLDRQCEDWARPYVLGYFGDEARADRYRRQGLSHYACGSYPKARADRIYNVGNLMISSTLFDDTFSKPEIQNSLDASKQLHAQWCNVFDGHRPDDDSPAFLMVYDSIEAVAAQVSERLAGRALQAWRDITDTHLDVAIYQDTDEPLTFDFYLHKRRINFYGWWLFVYAEYAMGIDLSDLSSMELMAAQTYANNHMTLVNDLYSFPKELFADPGMNAILVFLRQGLGLQQAVDRVVQLIHQAEAEFINVRDEILLGSLGARSDVRAYLDALGYLINGNLRWSQITPRYHGDDHHGGSITSGTITLRPRPTAHTLSA